MKTIKENDKDYLITLITNKKKEEMLVKAKSKRKAVKVVKDVISNCSLFNSKKIKIKCKKINL
ncbi:MAG: hypothetical protein J6B89_00395 [Bacilli bacterium]|nr:hypothetical protein [Bacilli bacterium]